MHGLQNLWDYKLWVSWFRGRFLANDSKASIDNESMDGRIYVGNHKTYIYKLWVSPFQKKKDFKGFFPIISLCICQSALKPHATFPLPYLMMLYM